MLIVLCMSHFLSRFISVDTLPMDCCIFDCFEEFEASREPGLS